MDVIFELRRAAVPSVSVHRMYSLRLRLQKQELNPHFISNTPHQMLEVERSSRARLSRQLLATGRPDEAQRWPEQSVTNQGRVWGQRMSPADIKKGPQRALGEGELRRSGLYGDCTSPPKP